MIFQSCKTEYQNNSISFIVCDDVPTEGEIIRTLIVDYLNKKTQPFDINVYSQPQKLLDILTLMC